MDLEPTNNCFFCGPQWLPVKLRAIASKYYNHACRLHDLDYNDHSSREDADRMFSNRCRVIRGQLRALRNDDAISSREYVLHSFFGLAMPVLTRAMGWLLKEPREWFFWNR